MVALSLILGPLSMQVAGAYRSTFRYFDRYVLTVVGKGLGIFAMLLIAINAVMGAVTLAFVQIAFFFFLFVVIRVSAALFILSDHRLENSSYACDRVAIYGAGAAGRHLCSEIASSNDFQVVGFFDDDQSLIGQNLLGKPVFDPKSLKNIITDNAIDEVLIALPSIEQNRRSEILGSLRVVDVKVRTVPSFSDIVSGRYAVQKLDELSIDDILQRDRVQPNPVLMAKDVTGNTVLVTGAGGSIGSELCRKILNQRPRKLVVFDHSEFALFSIFEELKKARKKLSINVELVALLGSVVDQEALSQIFKKHDIQVVFHAAAYKHVHLVEDNPLLGVRNNFIGTIELVDASIKNKVKKFVLVSTDKAVRPTSIMGASKRAAEMYVQSMAETQHFTDFAIVRFGNVLGSSGSVVPLFFEQIKADGPFTFTHENFERYFMTIEEQLSLL